MADAREAIDDRQALGGFLLALRTRGIRDTALLEAIERAPREAFLPLPYLGFAYQDIALPIGCGQEATSPFAVAEAVAQLDLKPEHRVLEIGTGSGWQTAVLARLAGAVASVERFRSLAEEAEQRLQRLGIANAVVAHADGGDGLPDGAPFDRIILNAAVERIPPAIEAQLGPAGVIVAPLIGGGAQAMLRIARVDGGLVRTRFGASRHPRLAAGYATHL